MKTKIKALTVESMAERNAAYCAKLEELLPKATFDAALHNDKFYDKTLPAIQSIQSGLRDNEADIWIDNDLYYTIKFLMGKEFRLEKHIRGKYNKEFPVKTFAASSVDELYQDPKFAKEIIAITKTQFSPTAAGQEKLAARASQALADAEEALPKDILCKALDDWKTQENLGWANLWCGNPEINFGTKKIYISPKGSNGHWELVQRKDGTTYTLTKMVFSQTYQDHTPRGKPRVFTANSVDELYQSADFAKAVADMKKDGKAGEDKRAREQAERDALEAPSTIYFKNYAALCAFLFEFSGQISDGEYENTKPYWHWVWMQKATCVVDPSHQEGYEGPSHPVHYDFRNLIRQGRGHGWQRRLLKYVWFGSVLDATGLTFTREQLSGVRQAVEQIFNASHVTAEDLADMGLSNFSESELDKIAEVIGRDRFQVRYEDDCNSAVRSCNNQLSSGSNSINENTKITLTIGQLRRLVKEHLDDDYAELKQTYDRLADFHCDHVLNGDAIEDAPFIDMEDINSWLRRNDFDTLRSVSSLNLFLLYRDGHYYLADYEKNDDGEYRFCVTDAEPVRDMIERVI